MTHQLITVITHCFGAVYLVLAITAQEARKQDVNSWILYNEFRVNYIYYMIVHAADHKHIFLMHACSYLCKVL